MSVVSALQAEPVPAPLSIYLHLPWCRHKCPYCDFHSYASSAELPTRAYVEALLRDAEYALPAIGSRPLCSLFLGGGTPSLFPPRDLEHLLSGLQDRLCWSPGLEITLEANPNSADRQRFRAYRELGINRLSIGVQSFQDVALRALGRSHGAREALAAVEAAHEAGFERLNLDLMYALPEQDPAAARRDLKQALALSPGHISWYQLTLEPGTAFYRQPPPLPSEGVTAEIEAAGRELLDGHGYHCYEISAYARSGHRCRHNLHYWRFGDYLGLGAGAHGKLSRGAPHSYSWEIRRERRCLSPQQYMARAGSAAAISGHRILDPSDRIIEFMLNALRLSDGVPLSLFSERTGLPDSCLRTAIDRAHELGLLEASPDHLQASARGQRYLNDLLLLFEPEQAPVLQSAPQSA